MKIPDKLNIPEEYRDNIFNLIKTHEYTNLCLAIQLLIGLNPDLGKFELFCYFRALMNLNTEIIGPTHYHILNELCRDNNLYEC